MKGTWVLRDELTDETVKVPTFPVCCIHRGQREGGGIIRYPYGPLTSLLKVSLNYLQKSSSSKNANHILKEQ